eukprot:TRINITY_DN1997_c0_g1_i2.p1 TRINITY_DN1997_c0_g1~~TRINITY_DN1997_c0_g1_i2.p1  ORF type:complete len:605 (+),score=61.85 TRINITY_DN1997_c0_g1_i2:650-2464(+)
MRMALVSFAWKRLVLTSHIWSFYWAQSGYQLSELRLRQLPKNMNSFLKYSVCAQAGYNLSCLRGSLIDLKAPTHAHLGPRMWLRGHTNQCSPRYIVYSTMETLQYSSYDSQECRGICFVDLDQFPTSITKTATRPWISGSMLFARDSIVYTWSGSIATVPELCAATEDAPSPFHPIPIPNIGSSRTVPNSHADYPWVIVSQRDAHGSMQGMVYNINTSQTIKVPIPSCWNETFNGPYLAYVSYVVLPNGQSMWDAIKISVFKIGLNGEEQSATPLVDLRLDDFQNKFDAVASDRYRIAFSISHQGHLGLFCRSKSSEIVWRLYTFDLSREFNLDEFAASPIVLELNTKVNVADMHMDSRYAYVNVSYHNIIIDHRRRKVVAAMRTKDYTTNAMPLDSTCLLLNARQDMRLLDLGLKGVSNPPSLPSSTPTYAVLNLDDPERLKGVNLVKFSSGDAAHALAHYLANPKLAIDGVPDELDKWTITYVLHTNLKVPKSVHTKTKDQFIHILRKVESSPVSSRAEYEALTESDLRTWEAIPALPVKFGHSRSGVRNASPATGSKLSFANEIVGFKLRTEKTANETIMYYPLSLSAEEALAAFRALKLI